ncbi:MAG: PQQ-binding-like beta-propeller repeat protein [Thermoplasmata archaeon]|nr:PQQ-binding-like beta-propeller repeat protein [Thermoplasmata archaeon]
MFFYIFRCGGIVLNKKKIRTNVFAVGILFLLCFSLIFPVTNSSDAISDDTNRSKDERFLYDREHNSENIPDEPTVFPFASSGIKDLIQTQIGINYGSRDSPWPVASHDVQHTGRSPYIIAGAPLVEKWRFPTDGWIFGAPVIDRNGTIYFSGYHFYAIDSNGTLIWKQSGYIDVHGAPAIDENGIIYAGTAYATTNRLYAFYPNGSVKWSYVTGNHIFSSPVIGDDGTIYFGDNNGNLNALYPNGTLKWITANIYSVYSSPAIADDGAIYCTSWYGSVFALYPNNGTVKWQFPTGGRMKANPSIADDGTIYVSSWDDYLYALYPNGTMKWKVNTKYGTSSNPSIGPDGTIYVGHTDLYAINTNGTVKWIFPLGNLRDCDFSAPAISADGIIYIGACIDYDHGVGGELIVVNPDGTERWRSGSICNEGIVSSPAIAEDGTVYVGSLNDEEVHSGAVTSKGFLHAFGPGELKKATMKQPIAGKVYFFGKEVLPTIFGKTFIIGNVTVRANATSLDQLDHIGFFVDGNIQYNSTEPPFEWNMNKNYFKGLIEYHRIRVTAFYKGGCEWSEERPVTYIHLRRT